jgi:hypothetical protein
MMALKAPPQEEFENFSNRGGMVVLIAQLFEGCISKVTPVSKF